MLKLLKRMYGYTKPYKFLFFPFITIKALNAFLISLFLAEFYANILSNIYTGSLLQITNYMPKLLILLLISCFLQMISTYCIEKSCTLATSDLRSELFNKILSAKYESVIQKHSGKTLSCVVNDIPLAMETLAQAVYIPIGTLVMGIGSFIYIFLLDIRLIFIPFILGLFTLVYSLFFAKLLRDLNFKIQIYLTKSDRWLKDLLNGLFTVRMSSLDSFIKEEYGENSKIVKNLSTRKGFISGILGGCNNCNDYISETIIFFVAGLMFLSKTIDLDSLIKISKISGSLISVFFISRTWVDIQTSLASAQKVFMLIDDFEDEKFGGQTKINASKSIQFDNVSFKYPNGNLVLENASFNIDKGEIIAFIGSSGNGKSTIFKLLEGFYTATDGNISILGNSISQWDLKSLRSKISFVPQETILFEGTIAENISYGFNNADMSNIILVAKESGADKFISKMPNGYDSFISENGNSLSGGEKQRIGIARALLREPYILILDEPTSSLDMESEILIEEALVNLNRKCTIILSSHKPSILKIADRIFSVKNKKVEEVVSLM